MNGKLPFLVSIVKKTYGKIIRFGGRIYLENHTSADLTQGPYIFLINHASILDPVFVSSLVPRHIRWVTGAYLFKNRLLKFIFNKCCTAIPKQQGRSDISTVKSIIKALKENDNVGLFPEGTRTWDGEIMPYSSYSVARLLKLCKVSVLFVHLKGAYAVNPRWADFKRKGKISVCISSLMTDEYIKKNSLKILEEKIQNSLYFSNDIWKQKIKYDYRTINRTSGIQRLLYLCPQCMQLNTIKGYFDEIKCTSCNSKAILNSSDNLESDIFSFENLAQWHKWEETKIFDFKSFPKEKGVLFQIGNADNNGVLKTLSKNFTVALKDNVLHIEGKKIRYKLELKDITSLILNAKQTMELFYKNVLYRIRLLPDACSLKYFEYYNAFVKNNL